MNILYYKRKVLGHTFRIEGDFGAEADSSGTGTGTGDAPDINTNLAADLALAQAIVDGAVDVNALAPVSTSTTPSFTNVDTSGLLSGGGKFGSFSPAIAPSAVPAVTSPSFSPAVAPTAPTAPTAPSISETQLAESLAAAKQDAANQTSLSGLTPTDVGSFASVTTEGPLSELNPTDVGSFSPVASVSAGLLGAALDGTLDAANLTKSDLSALQAMGFGNLQGANKNNPTQSINELYNSYALNDFLTENMPSPGTLASMVAGPLAGIIVDVATNIAQGKSATSVIGNVVGGILGQVISQVTGIPVSLNTLTALVDGQVGRAGLSVAFNAIANQTGLPVSAVQAGLSGNLGAAVQNTLTGALTSEAAKSLGVNSQFMGQVLGSMGLSTVNVASTINQIAAPLNEATAKITDSVSKIGVPTGVNNLAGAISSGAVNTTPVAEGGDQDEYLRQIALNSGISPAQAQTNATANPPSTGGIKINWNSVFGESSAANNKLPVVSTPTATGTAGTTGAMQGGFGPGMDIETDLTNAGLVNTGTTGSGTTDAMQGGFGSATGVTSTTGGAADASTGTPLKALDGDAVTLSNAELDALVAKQLIFEGGDYNTKQDAANAAKLAGFTQFEYDNSIYTMQPGGPTEKAVFQTLIDEAPTQASAFRVARDLLGTNQTFDYKGSKFTTITADEQKAQMQEAAYNDPTRALDNFYSGNIRYAGYDVAGDVAGKTRLTAPAQGVLDQLIATGAKGLGEQINTFAAGVALSTGTSLDTAASRLGDYLVQYGKDKDGTDVKKQEETVTSDWENAKNLPFFDQPGAIVKSIKENPLGFVSKLGGEVVQEGMPLIAGAIVGSTALAFGAPLATAGSIVAATSAVLNGFESFGAGGKEAYDLAIKAGASEDEARDKGITNGSIHAAITIPLEYIGDKAIVGQYFKGLAGGLKEYAKKFGSTVAVNTALEFVETVPQSLATRASVVGWSNLTKQDALSATASGFAASAISAGVTTGLISPAAINEAVSIGKDYAGNDVSFADFISGKKTVDLSTLKSDSVLGQDTTGNQITLGDALVNNEYIKIDPTFVDDFLPTNFVDPLITDETEARQIAKDLGYSNPSQEVLDSLVGPTSEADASAKLNTFLREISQYEAGTPVTAEVARDMMADLGIENMSDADAISLANKIVQSTESFSPQLNKQDVASIVNDAIAANPSLTEAQVQKIVSDATAALPAGVTAEQAKTIVDTAIKAIPAGLTTTDVAKIVSDAFNANPYVNKDQVASLISDAVGKIPPGMTADDVGKIVNAAVSNIPAGLSTQDVAKVVSDAIAQIPAGLSAADVGKIVGDAVKAIPAGISRSEVDTIVKDALAANPSLTAAQITKIVSDQVANIPPGITAQDVANQVNTAIGAPAAGGQAATGVYAAIESSSKALKDSLDAANKGNADAFARVDKAIADLAAAGLTEDDVQSIVDASGVQLSKEFSDAIDAASKGNAQALTDLGDTLQKSIDDTTKTLTDAIAANEKAGLSRDEATQKALDDVATQMGVNKQAVLDQLGLTAEGLTKQFEAGLGEVAKSVTDAESRLSDAIQAAKDIGLKGDEALQAGLDSVAAELGTTKENLLTQIGKTEAELTKQFEAGLGEVAKSVTDAEQRLADAIQAAKDIGLKGDAALQAGIDSVASELGITKESLLTQLGKTEEGLRTEFATGLGEVAKSVTDLEANLNQAIADNEAAGLTRDQATQKAVTDLAAELGTTKENLLTKLGTTEETLRTQIQESATALETQLTAQGKEFMDALVQQGMDQKTAFETAIAAQNEQIKANQEATKKQISEFDTQLNARIDALTKTGMDQYTATQTAMRDMYTGLTGQIGEVEKQRQADRDAAAAAAAEAERKRIADVEAQNAQAAANLRTTQVGQLRGQMMTGLQGLIGGLQQQATQMAAPGVVETVKATPGFDFRSPLNVGFFGGYESQKVPPKGQESTKIAEGGYLDDLLDAIR